MVIIDEYIELKENYNIKIALNIFQRLEEDMIVFRQKNKNILINKIISTYIETKNSDDLFEELFEKLKLYININTDGNNLKKILRENIYKSIIIKKEDESKSLNFRLNKNTYEACLELGEDSKYFNTAFFRGIFEWYTSKPRFEREKVILYEEYKKLMRSTKNQMEVKLEIYKSNKETLITYCKPLGIFSTKDENYNYLLTIGIDNSGNIYPTRLSNIKSVVIYTHKKFQINNEITEKIKNKIQKKNYTWNESEDIIIKLTEQGYYKYNTIFHLRPNFIKKEIIKKNYILKFREPQDTIFYYFTQFGQNFEILSPQSLKIKFRDFYENAFNNFKKNNS